MLTTLVLKTIIFIAEFNTYKLIYYPIKYCILKPILYLLPFRQNKEKKIESLVITIRKTEDDWDIISL